MTSGYRGVPVFNVSKNWIDHTLLNNKSGKIVLKDGLTDLAMAMATSGHILMSCHS